MNMHRQHQEHANDLGPLESLRVTRATEFNDWLIDDMPPEDATTTNKPVANVASPFGHESEYRLCKAVAQSPLKPSSQYAKLAGMSSKTAIKARRKLVEIGFIYERRVDSSDRGPSTMLLELSPNGLNAVAEYEDRSAKE